MSYNREEIVPDVLSGSADTLDVALRMIGESLPAKRRIGTKYRHGKMRRIGIFRNAPCPVYPPGHATAIRGLNECRRESILIIMQIIHVPD